MRTQILTNSIGKLDSEEIEVLAATVSEAARRLEAMVVDRRTRYDACVEAEDEGRAARLAASEDEDD